MPTASVLLNVEANETNRIAEELSSVAGVSEVYSVAGNYDLVAIARVDSNETLADLVTERIRGVKGIKNSVTLIAFRAYSRRDMNAMFAVD
jgi:DNA-binding Lrp family transcriptional regulator